ncbi:MAG: hypothetical protein K2N28_04440 [Muribaculaceae bacterium]|nr:hypothetical protein [Muribaculaceae bacterium]
MKKFYSLFLLLTMLLFTSGRASAVSATLQWDTPGTVALQLGNMSGPYAELSADQTSYEYETSSTYSSVYVYPAEGYALVNAVSTDGSITRTPSSYGGKQYINISITNTTNGLTYKINVVKIERNETFDIDIVNGLDYVTATFASGYTLDLKKGKNTYNFNPTIDGRLTLGFKNNVTPYSITLNGEPVASFYGSYRIDNLTQGSNLVIRVLEEEEIVDEKTDCKLTVEYGDGMEGSLVSIFDKTEFNVYFASEITDNSIVCKVGNKIKVNLNTEDYTYSNVTLDGKSLTIVDGSYVEFEMPKAESAILKIEGNARVWGTINFTGYIMGAEGVEFSEAYLGTALEMPAGESFSGSYSVGGYTLNSENSKQYTIPVSEKVGKIFFRPKAGYYIADNYILEKGKPEQHGGSASLFPDVDGTTFYMIVKKLETPYSFNVTATGTTYSGKLGSTNPITDCWSNPTGLNKMLTAGTTEAISFYPGYSVPVLLSVSGASTVNDAAVYLDGAPLQGTMNSESNVPEYTFTPYVPTAGDGIAEGAKSDVQVYLSSARPSLSGVSLELVGNAQAQIFYSDFRHVADPAGQTLISDTKVIVKPASKNLVVKYKGQPVELDENGEYIFNVKGAARNNIVTVSPAPKYTAIVDVDPATGSTVKKINEIKVIVPILDEEMSTMLSTDEAKIKAVTLTDGTNTYNPAEIGEPQAKYNDTWEVIGMEYPLLFTTAVTTAGNYTLTIPEGTFYEAAWDDATEAYTEVTGGYITSEYKATYTVDPSALSPIEDYTVSPVSGSELETIDQIDITFNQLKYADVFAGFENPETVTMTCGELEHECYIWINDEEQDVLKLSIVPMNEDWENDPITTPGVWTLVTNDITYKGEAVELHLTYTVTGKTAAYTITPEPGSTVDNLSEVTITFPDATTVDYNELPVTIKGADYEASSTDVHGSGNSWTVSFRNPAYDGEYTVTFPAGAFTIDGEESQEATATYTFESAYVLTPESGSILDNVEITIAFPHATNVEYVGSSASIMFTNNSSYASPSMNCVKDATASVPTFVISLPSTAQKPALGNYNLIIEEGAFEIDGKASAAIFADYTVEHSVSNLYNQDPDGTIVYTDWGISFALIFDETASITAPAKSAIDITVDGETVPANAYDYMVEGNYLMFMIFDPTYYKEGELNLKITEGAFKIGKMDSPAIDAKWNVVAPKTFEAVITPNENDKDHEVGPIEVAYINFPEATTGDIFNEYGVSLRNTAYSYTETATIEKVETAKTMADGDEAKGVTFAVKFPKATASGEYILSVREGTFVLDGVYSSPELTATYYVNATLTGISAILANGCDKVTVVTVDGKVIYNDAAVEVVNDLETGFYIINGQKLFIKK